MHKIFKPKTSKEIEEELLSLVKTYKKENKLHLILFWGAQIGSLKIVKQLIDKVNLDPHNKLCFKLLYYTKKSKKTKFNKIRNKKNKKI